MQLGVVRGQLLTHVSHAEKDLGTDPLGALILFISKVSIVTTFRVVLIREMLYVKCLQMLVLFLPSFFPSF